MCGGGFPFCLHTQLKGVTFAYANKRSAPRAYTNVRICSAPTLRAYALLFGFKEQHIFGIFGDNLKALLAITLVLNLNLPRFIAPTALLDDFGAVLGIGQD